MPGDPAARPWVLWLIGIAALGVLFYSAIGYGMVASLSPADPVPGQRSVAAYVYLILLIVSVLILVGAAIALIKRRGRERSRDASTAV
jgi:TRAP-type C4-dicarboxylate transport system permease small subunit